MWWILLVWLGVVSGGCARAGSKTSYDAFGNEIAEGSERQESRDTMRRNAPIVQRFAGFIYAPLCSGRRSPPSTHPEQLDGIVFEQPCGTIFQGFTEQMYPSFSVAHCLGIAEDRCRAAARNMFVSALGQRYTLADKRWIDQHCGAHPEQCDEPFEVEALYLSSHNTAALGALDRALNLGAAEVDERISTQRQAFLHAVAKAE